MSDSDDWRDEILDKYIPQWGSRKIVGFEVADALLEAEKQSHTAAIEAAIGVVRGSDKFSTFYLKTMQEDELIAELEKLKD